MISIEDYIDESHRIAVNHGWWGDDAPYGNYEDRNLGEQIALMHSELSEALEEYRNHGLDPLKFLYYEANKPEGIAVEFADLLIRVFDTCGRYGIPLSAALIAKMRYNETREYRHGGKLA